MAQGTANNRGEVSRVVNGTGFLTPGQTAVRVIGATVKRTAENPLQVVPR